MDRRQFLKAGVSSAAGFTLSGLTLSSWPRRVRAEPVHYEFVAEQVTKSLVDGAQVVVWQFSDVATPISNSGPGQLASSILVRAGDDVSITLHNNLDRSVDFSIPGIFASWACPSGETREYKFTAPAPGTYLYCDSRNVPLSRAMGLTGPLIVQPRLSDPSFAEQSIAREYTLFFNEIDSRVNVAIAQDVAPNLAEYQPNYFFVNGLSFPDTVENADTYLDMQLGSHVGIRMINGGLIYYPVHFHGYHVNVLRRNRQTEQQIIEKDTIMLVSGECTDLLLNVNQVGRYLIHTHYLPGTTANGIYGKGGIVMMNAVYNNSES